LAALKPEKTKLSDIVGKGYVAITLDQGKEPYQGIVELNGESLTKTVQDYFTQSEQSGVMLKITVGKTREDQWRAGGILLQHIPEEGGNVPLAVEVKARTENDTPEEQWTRACVLAGTVKDTELLDQYLPPPQLLYRLFNEDGVWVYGAVEVEEKCRCSRTKISKTLASFPKDEVEEFIVDGVVSINCQFCNNAEVFTVNELAALYQDSPPAGQSSIP
jgi:molecular chaperone Hsp33